ncbi:MAG: ketopantoate reductase [Alphaproteobacteria bacterium]|nr:ketopantoate reductase [Alphaproteobacteria bacterium]
MKILMFGRGVISTLYGWAFANAGHEVEYFVRPARLKQYGETVDVEIYDARSKRAKKQVVETLPTKLITTLDDDHDFDLIIVSVSHHSFAAAAKYLAPRLSNATLLIFNNFWDDPLKAAHDFPADQVVYGFPQGGGGFPNGKLRGLLMGAVMFGSFNPKFNSREIETRTLFEQAGFKISEQADIRGWLWVHFIFNGGMHIEQILAGSGAAVFQYAKHRKNVILNSRELLPLLKARGVDFKLHRSEITLMKLPAWIGSGLLWAGWKFYKPLKIMVESHSNPQDVLTTCEVLLDYAKEQNIATPRLERAVKMGRELG